MPSYAVVGASRGIGLGFVKKLSADPQNLVIALVRNPDNSPQLHEFVQSTDNAHKNIKIEKLDLEDCQSIQAAVAPVSAITGGALDVLISNGARCYSEMSEKTMEAYTDNLPAFEEDLMKFMRPNVVGTAQTIAAFLPLIRKGQTKKIVVVTSAAGSPSAVMEMGMEAHIGYGVSKAAINLITTKFAITCKKDGIIIVAVAPGIVKTLQGDPDTVDKLYEGIIARTRMPRGALTIEVSVEEQLKLLDEMTLERTGAFLHSHGTDANHIQ